MTEHQEETRRQQNISLFSPTTILQHPMKSMDFSEASSPTDTVNERTHLRGGVVGTEISGEHGGFPGTLGSVALFMIVSVMALLALTAKGVSVKGLNSSAVVASLTTNDDLEVDQVTLDSDEDELPFKISVWLMPPSDAAKRIEKQVDKIAEKYKSPKFHPHVTVVGGIEVQSSQEAYRMAESLKKGLKHFGRVPCSFDPEIRSYPTCWNQSLIATVEVSDAFFNLCQISRDILDLNPKNWTFPSPANVPHMSLFYGLGNIPDVSTVKPIESFEAHKIAIWKTVSSDISGVDGWVELDSFSLE
jgi:hypothetical protein